MTDNDLEAVVRPDTPASVLAEIAGRRPDLGASIAVHPNAYEDLLDWLAEYGTPESQRAVAERRAANAKTMRTDRSDPSGRLTDDDPAKADDRSLVDDTQAEDGIEQTPSSTLVNGEADSRARRRRLIAVGAVVSAVAVAGVVIGVILASRGASGGAIDAPAALSESSTPSPSPSTPTQMDLYLTAEAGFNATGVRVSITGDDGYSSQITFTSDPHVEVTLPSGGDFDVSLQPDSLPQGHSVSEASQDVTLAVGEYRRVLFTIGVSAVPQASAVWSLSTASGYSYDVRLAMGSPTTSGSNGSSTRSGEAASTPNTIGSACTDFDAKVDVAVPVTATFTPTTAGFDTPVNAQFQIRRKSNGLSSADTVPPSLSTVTIESEQFYSDDHTCETWSGAADSIGVHWEDPLKKGIPRVFSFTVIIKNYKSPNSPNGDPALFDWIYAYPTYANSSVTGVGTFSPATGAPVGLTLSGTSLSQ